MFKTGTLLQKKYVDELWLVLKTCPHPLISPRRSDNSYKMIRLKDSKIICCVYKIAESDYEILSEPT